LLPRIQLPLRPHRLTVLFALLFCLCSKGSAKESAPVDTAAFYKMFYQAEKQTNPDTAIFLLKALLQKTIALDYAYGCNGTLLKIGEEYMNKGDYNMALDCMKQALPYNSRLSLIEQSNYYQHLGWVYYELGDYVTASRYFYMALDYFEKNGIIRPNEVSICNDLGQVYFQLHQNEKARYYYDLGEAYAIKYNYQNTAAILLYNKGEYYTSINQLDSARKLYEKVNEIGERKDRMDVKAMANNGMGKTYIKSGDYKKAINYLQIAISLSENKYKPVWIEASLLLGEALFKTKNYTEAEKTLLTALKQASESKLKDNIINGYTTLTAVYKATGQYDKAINCMDSISVLKDSLVSADNTRAINLMDIKFQTAEKDKQIAQQNTKLAQKNIWILSIGGSVVLLLLLSAGFYFYTINKERSSEKENKIGILKAAVSGGDNERTRIARELHDGIGGMLSAAMMRFSSMHHDNAAVTQTPAYREAMDILREMGDEIRKTAHNLMPDVLIKQSLPEAVRAYCNIVQESRALKIDFQSYGNFDDLSQNHKLNLYRIIQELVKNILQHAGATNAMVQLLRNEDVLIVSVEDNGAGFDNNKMKTGLGLHNTQTRVSSLDGRFSLDSTPGKGTSVFIEIRIAKPMGNIIPQNTEKIL